MPTDVTEKGKSMQDGTDDPRYKPFMLKRYRHWTLYLDGRQRYLGRAVVWLGRAGVMQRFSGLTIIELLELQSITQDYEAALDEIGFKPDHMNYLMLGNYVHEHGGHGHMHLIPRYKLEHQPVFMGVTFTDDRWGDKHTPETPMDIPQEVLMGLVSALKEKLV